MRIALGATAALLAACGTPYQRMGVRGGVEEEPLGPNTWMISARGNGYTSRSTIVQYTYRRAGELCPGGFDVVDADRETVTGSYTIGRRDYETDRARATLIVRCTVQPCWQTRGVMPCEVRPPGR